MRDGSIHSQFFVAECHVPQFSIQEGETFPLTYYPPSAEKLLVVRVVQRLLDDRRLQLFPDQLDR